MADLHLTPGIDTPAARLVQALANSRCITAAEINGKFLHISWGELFSEAEARFYFALCVAQHFPATELPSEPPSAYSDDVYSLTQPLGSQEFFVHARQVLSTRRLISSQRDAIGGDIPALYDSLDAQLAKTGLANFTITKHTLRVLAHPQYVSQVQRTTIAALKKHAGITTAI